MLKKLQAWLHVKRQTDAAFGDQHVLLEWAQQQGAACRRVKHPQTGWVVEWPDGAGGTARLEWGSSRRPYIHGHELRWFFPCKIDASAEMVVLSQSFAKRIESELFGKLTANNHTTLESGLPDEVRWLAMWPAYLLPDARNTNSANSANSANALLCHSQTNAWRDVWATPEIVAVLHHAGKHWWTAESAVTLSYQRKILVLRLAADRLDIARLDQMKSFMDQLRKTIFACRF